METTCEAKHTPTNPHAGLIEFKALVTPAELAMYRAAPDMLDALRHAQAYLKPACEDGRHEARILADKIAAAIARAVAREPHA